ncbi:MAG: ATP-binding cassette domain-containing protein [Lachnospiraceae bacterium]|nr:ATP-binding cassette domain-containing protein [Lachnospiraceae bacterium]
MIEVTNLTKKYGNHVAVDHLSFRVEKGQIYGFLGPNGAGKSTTMNMITGYLAATEGTVLINGHDITKEPEEAKKSIGYLPELPPLYMDMTVKEYLKFAAELKKVPKTERQKQVAEVMEMTQITDMQGRLIKNLSKGYRQRVGFAQAILGYPEVIILDEPSVGLDPKQIIEIRDLIRGLSKNHTIILSSHILSEVSAVCDHIMIIAHGKLVASDSPEGLQRRMSSSRDGASMEVELTVKGSLQEVERAIMELEEVESVENKGITEENCVKLSVLSKNNVDIRESLFYALAEAKLPIMAMSHLEKSLEDIFLELTREQTEMVEPIVVAEGAEKETETVLSREKEEE